jgi:adenine-specific DNA-methyltransferase
MVSKAEQLLFVSVVDQINAITKDGDYITNATKQENVRKLDRQIDEMVYNLYGLNEAEKKVVNDTI